MGDGHRSRAQATGPAARVGILAVPHTRLGRLLSLSCLSSHSCKMEILTRHRVGVTISQSCLQRASTQCPAHGEWFGVQCVVMPVYANQSYETAEKCLGRQEKSLRDKYGS